MDILDKHREIADQYIEKINLRPDVIGIMYLGGLARGFADKYSDIDIAVFSYEPIKIPLGEQEVLPGYIIEVFNVALSEGYSNWNNIEKEAYQEGVLIHDINNIIATFLEKGLYYSKEKREKRIITEIFKMAWHGWVYTPFRNEYIKGYKWVLPNNLWEYRNNKTNDYYVAITSLNHFLDLLYAINYRFEPDFKWKFIKAQKLAWLPSDFINKMNYLLFESWNENTWNDKNEIFQSMLDETISYIKNDLPENWYEIIDK